MMKTTMILLLALSLTTLAAAQSPPSSDCTAAVNDLASCLSFLQGQAEAPDNRCCTNLRALNSANPACLCTLSSMADAAPSLNINTTRALELPARCNIPNVDASTCSGGGATSPTSSPTSNPPAPQAGGDNTPGNSAMSLSSPSGIVVFAAAAVGYFTLASRH